MPALDASAPIMAPPTKVRPRSQFNLFPEASPPPYTATPASLSNPRSRATSRSGSTPNSPATHQSPVPTSPPNFSRPHTVSQHPQPMADILSQAGVSPSNPSALKASPTHSRQSIFGTQMPSAVPLNRSGTAASSASRQTLSSERSQKEIAAIEQGLDKLENKKLGAQRYVPTPKKEEGMQAFALGAKLERALGRRLGGQDAVMRVRGGTVGDEKAPIVA